ncbi:MAG: type II methionyl aminopeptidase [Candidatus Aenigmarchaeota archaeon]|nr:type II methionyl aminopeptidase [Candidatus Aenigmarchaeota archaeon]
MDKDILEKYIRAGRICAEIKEELSEMLKPGTRLLTIAETVDMKIHEKGAKPAFPVNISLNEIAAHYTPSFNDEKTIGPKDLVKIDIGVHVDGYIGDMAFTYCSDPNPLVKCSEKCVEAAIEVIKPGVTVAQISEAIENTVKEHGFGLIVNLTGHTLEKYVFHGSPSIPNVSNSSTYKFREGDVIALEPFVVQSNGYVKDSGNVEIYRYLRDRPVRLPEARKILELAKSEYKELPFAKRWLYKNFSPIKVSLALRQLEAAGAIEIYPVLREIENKPIAQSEHTIIVMENPVVTTRVP